MHLKSPPPSHDGMNLDGQSLGVHYCHVGCVIIVHCLYNIVNVTFSAKVGMLEFHIHNISLVASESMLRSVCVRLFTFSDLKFTFKHAAYCIHNHFIVLDKPHHVNASSQSTEKLLPARPPANCSYIKCNTLNSWEIARESKCPSVQRFWCINVLLNCETRCRLLVNVM